MKFGAVSAADAAGLILAHSIGGLKKGRKLSGDDIALLAALGIKKVMAAQLEAEDIPEDEAARAISLAIVGANCEVQRPFTGRANIYSTSDGLLLLDEQRLAAFNGIHESMTLATLSGFERVLAKQMLATVKVIPFAVPKAALEQALALLGSGPMLRVQAFKPSRIGLLLTTLPNQKASLLEKSKKAIADRLTSLGSSIGPVAVCAHEQSAVAAHIEQFSSASISLVLLFGAAAIVDRGDVIPSGLVEAGGEVLHLGMPVDPGNLLMLGRYGQLPVVGVPTCARSPKINGFDKVLQRLLAGIAVWPKDIMAMGAGGLLAEIASRPLPRSGRNMVLTRPRIAAIVLAGGLSTRLATEGLGNKLLSDLHGRPLIVQTVERIKASGVDQVFVVTGHQAEEIRAALSGQDVNFVHNQAFPSGLASSLRAGVEAVLDFDAVLVCLGDMPLIEAEDLQRMVAAFNIEERILVAPVYGHKLGNPVLWGRPYFDALMGLSGDRGARSLLEAHRQEATEILVSHEGFVLDADTPEALARLRSV